MFFWVKLNAQKFKTDHLPKCSTYPLNLGLSGKLGQIVIFWTRWHKIQDKIDAHMSDRPEENSRMS